MNLNIKTFLLCSIPEDQKPINDYIQLKDNFFLNWIQFPQKNYPFQLLKFFFFWFIVIGILLIDDFFKNFRQDRRRRVIAGLLVYVSLLLQHLWQHFPPRMSRA
jgi:hypothetical protein